MVEVYPATKPYARLPVLAPSCPYYLSIPLGRQVSCIEERPATQGPLRRIHAVRQSMDGRTEPASRCRFLRPVRLCHCDPDWPSVCPGVLSAIAGCSSWTSVNICITSHPFVYGIAQDKRRAFMQTTTGWTACCRQAPEIAVVDTRPVSRSSMSEELRSMTETSRLYA